MRRLSILFPASAVLILLVAVLLGQAEDACVRAQRELDALLTSLWVDEPVLAGKRLRPALQSTLSGLVLPMLTPASARCCANITACVSLGRQPSAAALQRFLHYVATNVEQPRQGVLRRASEAGFEAPRVVVVGAGPAGLPAAVVAHTAGASVAVVEKRHEPSRPVWFDLEPPPPRSDAAPAEGVGLWSTPPGRASNAQQLLRSWGFFELRPSTMPDEGGSGVLSVQCETLERFGLILLSVLGVELRTGTAFSGVCADEPEGLAAIVAPAAEEHGRKRHTPTGAAEGGDSAAALEVASCDREQRAGRDRVPFDILLGADGGGSRVRASLGLTYAAQSRFELGGGAIKKQHAGLSQVSLNLAFEMDATGRCPQVWRDPSSGAPLPPHDASFDEPGVSFVFKRLYERAPNAPQHPNAPSDETSKASAPHSSRHATPAEASRRARRTSAYCELQLLFEEFLGAPLLAAHEVNRSLPLPLLLRLTRKLLARPYASEEALFRALRRSPATGAPDAAFLRIKARRSSATGRLLTGPRPASVEEMATAAHEAVARGELPTGPPVAIGLLRGDALASAHYRLGIGVNMAYKTLPILVTLLDGLWADGGRGALRKPGAAAARLAEWDSVAASAASAMVTSQLSYMCKQRPRLCPSVRACVRACVPYWVAARNSRHSLCARRLRGGLRIALGRRKSLSAERRGPHAARAREWSVGQHQLQRGGRGGATRRGRALRR